jgi:hypothetical protein
VDSSVLSTCINLNPTRIEHVQQHLERSGCWGNVPKTERDVKGGGAGEYSGKSASHLPGLVYIPLSNLCERFSRLVPVETNT